MFGTSENNCEQQKCYGRYHGVPNDTYIANSQPIPYIHDGEWHTEEPDKTYNPAGNHNIMNPSWDLVTLVFICILYGAFQVPDYYGRQIMMAFLKIASIWRWM